MQFNEDVESITTYYNITFSSIIYLFVHVQIDY